MEISQKKKKTKVLEDYHNPMSDEEYLEKYQNAYGILSEEQKEEVLKYYHNPMSDEEFMKALKQFELH